MSNPEDTAGEIRQLYQELESYIATLLTGVAVRALRRPKRFMKRRQRIMGEVQRKVAARVARTHHDVQHHTTRIVRDTYVLNKQAALTIGVRMLGGKPLPSVPHTRITPDGITTHTLNTLASQYRQVERTAAKTTREVIDAIVSSQLADGSNPRDLVQTALDKFADKGITTFTDRAGRQWNLASYSEMAIRTGVTQARNEGQFAGFLEAGISIVRVSHHPASAPQCYPYQNELLSLDGVAGERQMVSRTTGKPITVRVMATMDDAVAAGYHHPNCGHRDMPYVPGTPTPTPPSVSAVENGEQYKARQYQRRLERDIRTVERQRLVTLDPKQRAAYVERKTVLEQRLQNHIDQHGFLSRDVWRETVHG